MNRYSLPYQRCSGNTDLSLGQLKDVCQIASEWMGSEFVKVPSLRSQLESEEVALYSSHHMDCDEYCDGAMILRRLGRNCIDLNPKASVVWIQMMCPRKFVAYPKEDLSVVGEDQYLEICRALLQGAECYAQDYDCDLLLIDWMALPNGNQEVISQLGFQNLSFREISLSVASKRVLDGFCNHSEHFVAEKQVG